MTTTDLYLAIAQSYAHGVRVFFAPSDVDTGERGGSGLTSAQDLAEKAENLSPKSVALTQAIAGQLTDADDLSVRTEASVRLLAKALTDLEVSAYLYQAATEEAEGISRSGDNRAERSLADFGRIEENLEVLLHPVQVSGTLVERGQTEPTDIPTARVELSNTVEDTLASILDKASGTGESALGSLMGLGVTELAQAVGFVGMDIAEVLGQGENVSSLYNAGRDFFNRAYESVTELLGQQLAQAAAQQVLEWVNELKEGTKLSTILERFYQTAQTSQDLKKLAATSQAQLEQFIAAIQDVSVLDSAYSKQIRWAEKVLKGLKRFGTLSKVVLPQGQLVLPALYITLGGYVILVGADYVDSPNLTLLDCVPGVRRVVETNLATALAKN